MCLYKAFALTVAEKLQLMIIKLMFVECSEMLLTMLLMVCSNHTPYRWIDLMVP